MRIFRYLLPLAIAALLIGVPTPSSAQVYVSLTAPPLLPQYDQPMLTQPNYVWTPGYWAWGSNGYYWVPGSWTQPPQPGLYWTPGYWGQNTNGSGYAWNDGYWGPQVGYYGGINYGYGYYGNGYVGGQWSGNNFRYNTAINTVNPAYVRYVYSNPAVIVRPAYRWAYNGRGGYMVRPTAQQIAWRNSHPYGLTPWQRQRINEAAQDRANWAKVNHGRPMNPVYHPAAHPAAAHPNEHPNAMKPAAAHPAAAHPNEHPAAKPPASKMAPAHPDNKPAANQHPPAKPESAKEPNAKATHSPI